MKILVTGGAGFIGSNFIHYWLAAHPADAIINLDKLTYAGNLSSLKSVENDARYQYVKGDICDYGLVTHILEQHDIDVIVHFAAHSHVDRSVMLKELGTLDIPVSKLFEHSLTNDFILNNVWGTHILLEAAVRVWQGKKYEGKRFHYISTDEVFGALRLEDKNLFHEEMRYDPRSPYAASKASADHLVRAYHTTFGLPVTISNTSNNFGPYQYPEKLLPLAVTNLLEGKPVPIYGDGKYVRDWLYVDDHCRAIDLILAKGAIGETYCIGGLTEDVDNLQLIRKVLQLMGKDESSLTYVKDRPGHDRRYAVNWSKAKRELGYEPKHTLDEYLAKTVQWYQDNRWWWEPIKNGEFREWYAKQYEQREQA